MTWLHCHSQQPVVILNERSEWRIPSERSFASLRMTERGCSGWRVGSRFPIGVGNDEGELSFPAWPGIPSKTILKAPLRRKAPHLLFQRKSTAFKSGAVYLGSYRFFVSCWSSTTVAVPDYVFQELVFILNNFSCLFLLFASKTVFFHLLPP